jgi:hypothetical protein
MPVTQTLEFSAGTGLTISCKLFAIGSDTVVATATATEKTNDKNRYSVAFTDIPAGAYRLNGFVSGTGGFANEVYDLTLSTATFQPRSESAVNLTPVTDALTDIKGAGWTSSDSLKDIKDVVDGLVTTGVDPNSYTVTVEASGGSPLADIPVSIESSGSVVAWGRTDAAGEVVFGLAAGSYDVVVSSSAAYTPASPVAITIPTDTADTITLTPQSISPPATPGLCTVRFSVVHQGSVVSGATVTAEVDTLNSTVDTALVARTKTTGTTNGSGYVDLVLIRKDAFTAGGTYRVKVKDAAGVVLYSRFVTIPNANTATADDLVPV